MQPINTLNEISKYLSYASDALHGAASTFGIDRHDRQALEKYAADILEYTKRLDQLKLKLVAKEHAERKQQVVAELEYTYEKCKRITKNAQENVRITNKRLEQVEKDGSKKDIEEYKRRLAFYMKEYLTAQQNEASAKHAFNEQGA